MKICLLIPDFLSGTSFLQQPLDYLYTASVLLSKKYDVSVLDCRVHHLSMASMLEKIFLYDVIVVSTTPIDQVQNYFLDYRYAYTIKTIDKIKLSYPQKVVIVYGAHVSANSNLVTQDINADFFIKGEIFITLPALLDEISNRCRYSEIPNIIFKKGKDYVHTKYDESSYHPAIPDDIFPSYDLIDMSQYFGDYYINNIPLKKQNRVVAYGGRGCPFACTFCHNFFGGKVNYRSPKSVATELKVCHNKYGVDDVFFLDEVFTLNKQWVHELRRELELNNLKMELTIQTRVDCVDNDILDDLVAMGVKNIWLGMESMNDRILTVMNKKITTKMILDCIDAVRMVNIQPHVFFMVGVEGENSQTIYQLLKSVAELNIPYTRSVMICTPRYGTTYYEHARSQYSDIRNWFDLNRIKGLVGNEMTPSLLLKAKKILKSRMIDISKWDKC